MERPKLTAAEATDRHGRLVLISIVLASLMVFSNAVEDVADPALAGYMKMTQAVLIVGMVAALAPCFVWWYWTLRRLPVEEQREYFAADSFIVHALKRAKSASWVVVLMLLIVMGPMSKRSGDLPTEFFFDMVLGIMLGVFGVYALILSR